MGLVVQLGVCPNGECDEERVTQMEAILRTGCTLRLREVIPGNPRRVLEVCSMNGVVQSRSVPVEDLGTLWEDLDELDSTRVSFSYEGALEVGAQDIQSFAVEFDSSFCRPEASVTVGGERHRVVSLLRSQRNWLHESEATDLAWRLHRLARQHHLAVRSM